MDTRMTENRALTALAKSMYTARFGCVNRTEDLGMPCRPGPGESSRNFLRVHMCPSSVMDAQNWSDDAKRRYLAPKPTPSTDKGMCVELLKGGT